MKLSYIPVNTSKKYEYYKFDGVLGDIADHLESYNVIVIDTVRNHTNSSYEYVAMHNKLGLIYGIIYSTKGILIIDPITNTKCDIAQLVEFYNCDLYSNLVNISTKINNVNLSLDQVNSDTRRLVEFIQHVVIHNSLDVHIDDISLECDKLIVFRMFSKSITVYCDKLIDSNLSTLSSQLDLLLYLNIK
jgi:hypothetical protein